MLVGLAFKRQVNSHVQSPSAIVSLFGKYGPQIPWFIMFAIKVALTNCINELLGASLALQALLVLYENESCEVTIAMLCNAYGRSEGMSNTKIMIASQGQTIWVCLKIGYIPNEIAI